jgi:autotransporter translocation and assembly factor TamB
MLLSKTLRAAALLAAFALPALGCSDDNSPSGTTSLTVNMTDAAGDIKAAVVTISEIYLVGSGDQAHVTLTSTPVTTNLLDLANSTKTLVDAQDVTDGTYSELRFVITGGYVEVENDDGSTSIYASSSDYAGLPAGAAVAGQLQMPSLGQSGLKVDLPADALTLDGTAETLLLDFDVSQSFGHAAGNSGTWVMHPVIKGATFTEAAKAHATLALGTGVTLPDVAGSAITLADFSAVLTSSAGGTETQPLADTDADGTFDATFDFLLPGDYTVTFTGPTGLTFTTDPAGPIAVTAASGTTADAGATVTAATATP